MCGEVLMRGSVVKKNDRWYVVIEDRDPATGARKRRWHSGFRTKREAQAACNELAAAMQRGDCLQANRQTVGEFAQEWLVTIAPTVRPSTLDKYQRDLRAHGLRHTWATIALQTGIHPRVVQERPGHSNISITLQTYSHVLPTMHDDAAISVAALFMLRG